MNLREKQMQMTREIIKDRALSLFCAQGIERTDMAQIAEQAGISRRTLYHHYKDKEELAAQIYVLNLERMFGQSRCLILILNTLYSHWRTFSINIWH